MKEPVAGTMLRCAPAPWGMPGIGFQLQEWSFRHASGAVPVIQAIAEPVIMKAVENPTYYEQRPETFMLAPNAAQVLMDDLWRAGIRPTEGAGSAGSMAATIKHLEDFRRLVFDHIVIKKGDK